MASVSSGNHSSIYSKSSHSRVSSSDIDTDDEVNLQKDYTTILNNLREGKPYKKLNILIVGKNESGKSSLINSLIMAINIDGYKEVAGRESPTILKGYNLVDALSKKRGNFICNPCLLECPGFADVDDENTTLILRQIINGQLLEGCDIAPLASKTSKQLTTKKSKNPLVDVIIVVQSADEEVAEKLYGCVIKASLEHEVPVFCVMAKTDLVTQDQTLKTKCKNIAKCFGIQEQPDKLACCRLYPVDNDNPFRVSNTDREMCKIWNAISQSYEYRPRKKTSSPIAALFKRK